MLNEDQQETFLPLCPYFEKVEPFGAVKAHFDLRLVGPVITTLHGHLRQLW